MVLEQLDIHRKKKKTPEPQPKPLSYPKLTKMYHELKHKMENYKTFRPKNR